MQIMIGCERPKAMKCFRILSFLPFFSIQLVYIQLIAIAAIKHVFGLLLHSAHPLTLTTGNFIFEEAT